MPPQSCPCRPACCRSVAASPPWCWLISPPHPLLNTPPVSRRQRVEKPRTEAFRERFFPDIEDDQWNDWRWQSRNRIRTLSDFERVIDLSTTEREALEQGGTMLPIGVTPYYMSLLDPHDPSQPLRRTVVPTTAEFQRTAGEADDPLGEDGHSPVPGLVHRYPDRVLLLPLDFCSTYCRYCTRSRVVGHGEISPNEARLEAIFDLSRRRHAGPGRIDFGGRPPGIKQREAG